MNNSTIDRFKLPLTNFTSFDITSETITISSGSAGDIADFYTINKPILRATKEWLGGDGNSSLVLTSTTFLNEVAYNTPDDELAEGDYWVDYLTGHGHGRRADNAASLTADYSIFFNNIGFLPNNLGNWPPGLPPDSIVDALNELAKRKTVLTISSLNTGGAWYPLQYVGPTYGQNSTSIIVGYNSTGFLRAPRAGTLKNFKFSNSSPPFSDVTVQLWHAAGGIPSALAFTGITLTMVAGEYLASNTSDTYDVAEDDLLVFYNADPFIGYTPDMMTITADLI